MDLLRLIDRDIKEIAEFGYCNFAETFKTLVLAKKEIEMLRRKVDNGVLDDVSVSFLCDFVNQFVDMEIPEEVIKDSLDRINER